MFVSEFSINARQGFLEPVILKEFVVVLASAFHMICDDLLSIHGALLHDEEFHSLQVGNE